MRKKEKRVKALKGLFVPDFWQDVKEVLVKCELMTRASKGVDLDDLTDIEFVFERGDKMVVYREFIQAFKKGWIGVRLSVVIRYMAEYTNLADADTLEKRIKAIQQGFKRYKGYFN